MQADMVAAARIEQACLRKRSAYTIIFGGTERGVREGPTGEGEAGGERGERALAERGRQDCQQKKVWGQWLRREVGGGAGP